jgi:NTE family protein
VLGGGGMFGAYQAGVWQALEGRFDFDLVAGASIGALNGWAIAARCPASVWAGQWLHPEPGSLPLFRFPCGPRAAAAGRAAFETLVRRVHSSFQPCVPFCVALTDLLRLEPYAVRTPHVDWVHLAASCAVPLFLPQYRIGGRWTTDGGILGSVPLWAATRHGATRIVAVNILPRGGSWWLRAARAAVRAAGRPGEEPPDGARVVMIEHPRPLGPLREMLSWSPEAARRLVDLGRREAESALPAVEALFRTF